MPRNYQMSWAPPAVYDPFYGQVANGCFVPTDAISGPCMSYTSHYVYDACPDGLYVCFPNWLVTVSGGVGENSSGLGTLTGKWAIEYPTGVYTPFTFSGGGSTGTAAAGADLWGFCPVAIPSGITLIKLRAQHVSTGNLPFIYGSTPTKNSALGEALEATATDKTASGTIANNVFGGMFPIAIVARTSLLSFACVGDSIAKGQANSSFDGHRNQGTLSQALGRRYAHINLGVSGEPASAFTTAKAPKRIAHAKRCTHITLAHGKNDLLGSSAGQLAAAMDANAALFSGWPIHYVTMQPATTGAWTLADRSDQTVSSSYNNTVRNTENARRLAIDGTIDVNPYQAVGDKWLANGTPAYATPDGIHPSSAGDILGVAALAGFAFTRGGETSRMATSAPF